jgi:hypothetical protein
MLLITSVQPSYYVTESVGEAANFHLSRRDYQPDTSVAYLRKAYKLHAGNQKNNPTCLFIAGHCSALKTVSRPA